MIIVCDIIVLGSQVESVLSMVSSMTCDQSDQPLVEPDPEDLAEEQGLLARWSYIQKDQPYVKYVKVVEILWLYDSWMWFQVHQTQKSWYFVLH